MFHSLNSDYDVGNEFDDNDDSDSFDDGNKDDNSNYMFIWTYISKIRQRQLNFLLQGTDWP